MDYNYQILSESVDLIEGRVLDRIAADMRDGMNRKILKKILKAKKGNYGDRSKLAKNIWRERAAREGDYIFNKRRMPTDIYHDTHRSADEIKHSFDPKNKHYTKKHLGYNHEDDVFRALDDHPGDYLRLMLPGTKAL